MCNVVLLSGQLYVFFFVFVSLMSDLDYAESLTAMKNCCVEFTRFYFVKWWHTVNL